MRRTQRRGGGFVKIHAGPRRRSTRHPQWLRRIEAPVTPKRVAGLKASFMLNVDHIHTRSRNRRVAAKNAV